MIIIALLMIAVIWADDLIERNKILKEQQSILGAINSARDKHLIFMAEVERVNQ